MYLHSGPSRTLKRSILVSYYQSELRLIFVGIHIIAAQKGKRVVVIGSSFISMELVVALAKRGLESIDVIGMEEYPFEAVLGKEVGKGLMKVC